MSKKLLTYKKIDQRPEVMFDRIRFFEKEQERKLSGTKKIFNKRLQEAPDKQQYVLNEITEVKNILFHDGEIVEPYKSIVNRKVKINNNVDLFDIVKDKNGYSKLPVNSKVDIYIKGSVILQYYSFLKEQLTAHFIYGSSK